MSRLPWLLLLALSTPAGVHAGTAEQGDKVGRFDLRLSERDGRCVLHVSGPRVTEQLTLTPLPPCGFFRRRERGELVSYRFSAPLQATVVAVVGTPLTEGQKRYRWLKGRSDCGSQSQGVIVGKTRVTLSRRIAERVPQCAYLPPEAVEYSLFYADR